MGRAHRWLGGLMLCLTVAGCSAGAVDEEDTVGDESAALTGGSFAEGQTVITTSRLRFRDGPSTSAGVIEILPFHAQLTVVDGQTQNGFVHVQKEDGTDGYCHGAYLRSGSGGTTGGGDNGGGNVGSFPSNTFRARGTGYYPANNAMEGGFVDRRGVRLRTLQQFLNGSAEYVSVAMDPHAFNYGQKLRIKELEQKYGRVIEFRVVDTGGAFMGKGKSRIDICVQNSSASVDPTINGMLTIASVD